MKVLIIVCMVLLILCGLTLIFLEILMCKNKNTCKNQIIITHAIGEYHRAMIKCGAFDKILVDYEDMRDYNKTLWRIFDWGYTHILPKDKYEIIKRFIDPSFRYEAEEN